MVLLKLSFRQSFQPIAKTDIYPSDRRSEEKGGGLGIGGRGDPVQTVQIDVNDKQMLAPAQQFQEEQD